MEFIILLVIAVLSLLVGFFLGILFFKLDTPLVRTLKDAAGITLNPEPAAQPAAQADEPEPVEEQPQSADGRAAGTADSAKPEAQLILEVWLEGQEDLQFVSFGRSYRRDQLPEPLLKILQMDRLEKVRSPQPDDPQPLESAAVQPLDEDIPQKKEVKLLSVIQEIDKILQKKLVDSPLNNKGIQLMENQHQEIQIWVGLQSYDNVEDIPDPEVRALILDSVEEWENKNE